MILIEAQDMNLWRSLGHGLEADALTPTNWAYLQIKVPTILDTLICNTNQVAHYILYFSMNFGLYIHIIIIDIPLYNAQCIVL